MSLAELLKADLDDLEDEQEDFENESQNNDFKIKSENYEIEDVGMAVDDIDEKMSMNVSKESVRNIAKLLDSQQLKRVIDKIEMYQSSGSTKRGEIVGPVEEDPE